MRLMISYRRSDSAAISGRIGDTLAAVFGRDNVYMDVTSIPYGTEFKAHIEATLREVNVVIVIIGRDWHGLRADGTTRIKDDPDDVVRFEIETALRENLRVIPVTVEGAVMPKAAELPSALKKLAGINAPEVRTGADFASQMQRLVASIDPKKPAHELPRTVVPQTPAVPDLSTAAAHAVLPVALLTLLHYIVVVKFDLPATWLMATCIVAMLAFGAFLFSRAYPAYVVCILAAVIGLAAVTAMLTVTSSIQGRPVVPYDLAGWQETFEFLAAIVGSGILGYVGARMVAQARSA